MSQEEQSPLIKGGKALQITIDKPMDRDRQMIKGQRKHFAILAAAKTWWRVSKLWFIGTLGFRLPRDKQTHIPPVAKHSTVVYI